MFVSAVLMNTWADAFGLTELIPAAIEKIDGYGVLPDGESVSVSGKKWVVADGVKAAKVTYKKGVLGCVCVCV